MSHSSRMDVDQSLIAKIKDQNENSMHGKTSTTVPNHPKNQIKHAVHNTMACWLPYLTDIHCVTILWQGGDDGIDA
jgi:hypothetical protein